MTLLHHKKTEFNRSLCIPWFLESY